VACRHPFFFAPPSAAPARAARRLRGLPRQGRQLGDRGHPSIAAQPVAFLENQLVFFREGLRNAPVMEQVAKGMKDEDITALARHFLGAERRPGTLEPPYRSLVARGRELAEDSTLRPVPPAGLRGPRADAAPRGPARGLPVGVDVGYRDAKRTGADTTMQEVLGGMSDATSRRSRTLGRLGVTGTALLTALRGQKRACPGYRFT
jgi:hypothetical protein